jgi:hypothetical protein
MKTQKLNIILLVFFSFFVSINSCKITDDQKPIRLAVAGMTHGHISFILNRPG